MIVTVYPRQQRRKLAAMDSAAERVRAVLVIVVLPVVSVAMMRAASAGVKK